MMEAKIKKDGYGKYLSVCHNGYQWSGIEISSRMDAELIIKLLQIGVADGIFERNGKNREEIQLIPLPDKAPEPQPVN